MAEIEQLKIYISGRTFINPVWVRSIEGVDLPWHWVGEYVATRIDYMMGDGRDHTGFLEAKTLCKQTFRHDTCETTPTPPQANLCADCMKLVRPN